MVRVVLHCLLASLAGAVCAHDLWIERQDTRHTLRYGHHPASHEGQRQIEYKPASVQDGACFDLNGGELKTRLGRDYPVALDGACAASWFQVSTGYWSKTPYGLKNLPKTEAGSVIDSWSSVESVKRLDRWGAGLAKPLTPSLEIVPEVDPLRLKVGDKLRLTVHWQSKPVAGATVAYFGRPRGVTGTDGRVNVRLQQAGFQLVEAGLEMPLNDGKADKLVQSTALQFDVAP
jgi:nickel transport protein